MNSVTIIIADLSRYDDDAAAGQYPGVVLNVEDPNLRHKAQIAHDASVPILIYSWVYPSDSGHSTTRAEAAVELLAADGIQATGFAFHDYEQNGVVAADLEAGLNLADQQGLACGTYTYLALLNGQPGLADLVRRTQARHPLWIAYYLSDDGHYEPSMSDTARQWGAVLHQFTSSGGNRDLSAVLDEEWWASIQGDNMPIPDDQMAKLGEWMKQQTAVLLKVLIGDGHITSENVLGAWEGDTRKVILAGLAGSTSGAVDPKALADAVADALGDAEAKKVADELAKRLAS